METLRIALIICLLPGVLYQLGRWEEDDPLEQLLTFTILIIWVVLVITQINHYLKGIQ